MTLLSATVSRLLEHPTCVIKHTTKSPWENSLIENKRLPYHRSDGAQVSFRDFSLRWTRRVK